ncbi:hypothetical protein SLEP1_g20192 [Rubroshorea leprosula]|uniref:Trichome birefringence-like C-terminal domain-containing protein n=1 Tax=Rubroshorea leprosula TaxID=152421 RepID=A0AAV5JAW4_9ROSI|nr:hypothetical protein SLEP1_g20192 [Rubroshorea leprosula]
MVRHPTFLTCISTSLTKHGPKTSRQPITSSPPDTGSSAQFIFDHDGGKVIGCVYCNEPSETDHRVAFALKLTFRSVLRHINTCNECRVRGTLLRTFSPVHFEHAVWNTGGSCNRTSPFGKEGLIWVELSGK